MVLLLATLGMVAAACLPNTAPIASSTVAVTGLATASVKATATTLKATTTTVPKATTTTVPKTTTTTAPKTTTTTVPKTTTTLAPIGTPTSKQTSATTVPTSTPPDSSVVDVCASLQSAAAGGTVTVPAGTWNIGNCVVDGLGRANVTVRSQYQAQPTSPGGTTSPTSRLVGSLRCNDCDGWLFDGLVVEGNGSLVDPTHVVAMARGNGWRWTNCELTNGVDAAGVRYGVRGVFNTWQEIRNWQVDHCWIHANGNTRPTVADNNFDHLVYLNGYTSSLASNGRLGPGNVFEDNRSGAPVKVGFGVDASNLPVGVRGVTVEGNTLRNNGSPDGLCGVLVAGNSPDTVVARNTIDCTSTPAETTKTPVALRDWPSGAAVRIESNSMTGALNSGTPTACGSLVAGPYDQTISVKQWLPQAWFTISVGSCGWQGITSIGNTTSAS